MATRSLFTVIVVAGCIFAHGSASAVERCVDNPESGANRPDICVDWDKTGTPAEGLDFDVFFTDLANPDVTLATGAAWNVRSKDDSGNPANIGDIKIDATVVTDNFDLAITDNTGGFGVGGPGAANVGSIILSDLNGVGPNNDPWGGRASITTAHITGNFAGELIVESDRFQGLAFDPNSDTLYGSEVLFGELNTIDTATGVEKVIGLTGEPSGNALAFNANTLYGIDGIFRVLVEVNTSNGMETHLNPAMGFDVNALAPRDNATLFGVGVDDEGHSQLITIITDAEFNDQRASVIGPLDFENVDFANVRSLAYDADLDGVPPDPKLYGVDVDVEGNRLITIDTSTGEGTAVGGALGFSSVESLAFDDNTDTLYGYDTALSQLITIDTSTGAGTAVNPPQNGTGGRIADLTIDGEVTGTIRVNEIVNLTIDVANDVEIHSDITGLLHAREILAMDLVGSLNGLTVTGAQGVDLVIYGDVNGDVDIPLLKRLEIRGALIAETLMTIEKVEFGGSGTYAVRIGNCYGEVQIGELADGFNVQYDLSGDVTVDLLTGWFMVESNVLNGAVVTIKDIRHGAAAGPFVWIVNNPAYVFDGTLNLPNGIPVGSAIVNMKGITPVTSVIDFLGEDMVKRDLVGSLNIENDFFGEIRNINRVLGTIRFTLGAPSADFDFGGTLTMESLEGWILEGTANITGLIDILGEETKGLTHPR